MNPHPIIFPKLIQLWNEHPAKYHQHLNWFMGRGEREQLLEIIRNWIKETNHETYLNEY